jgi:hypothetical protein
MAKGGCGREENESALKLLPSLESWQPLKLQTLKSLGKQKLFLSSKRYS